MPEHHAVSYWMDSNCSSLDGQFLFLDPVWWNTHLLSEGAVQVLREAAVAIESRRFDEFLQDVEAAGGWPSGLEHLAQALASFQSRDDHGVTMV